MNLLLLKLSLPPGSLVGIVEFVGEICRIVCVQNGAGLVFSTTQTMPLVVPLAEMWVSHPDSRRCV